jgi:hypothetical protein
MQKDAQQTRENGWIHPLQERAPAPIFVQAAVAVST